MNTLDRLLKELRGYSDLANSHKPSASGDMIKTLRTFLEKAHKNGVTTCEQAEEALKTAREISRDTLSAGERAELTQIITELEQIHTLCETPNPRRDGVFDETSELDRG